MAMVAAGSGEAVKGGTRTHYNSSTRRSHMTNRLLLALACVLLIVRLPSLVQPMGGDEGLYAYVGERILDGGVPYRDAWDQKPPGIHFAYAVLWRLWPYESVVPAADLAVAAVTAALLVPLGRAVAGFLE